MLSVLHSFIYIFVFSNSSELCFTDNLHKLYIVIDDVYSEIDRCNIFQIILDKY